MSSDEENCEKGINGIKSGEQKKRVVKRKDTKKYLIKLFLAIITVTVYFKTITYRIKILINYPSIYVAYFKQNIVYSLN